MRSMPMNDKTIMDAVKAQNNGHHLKAASLFQEAGNQYRNPADKKALWDAAEKARQVHYSD